MLLTLAILATLARNSFNLTQRYAKAQRDAKTRFQNNDVNPFDLSDIGEK